MNRYVAVLMLGIGAAGCADGATTLPATTLGQWGGDGVSVDVKSDNVIVRGACWGITLPVRSRSSGESFSSNGILNLGFGRVPVSLVFSVVADTMSLSRTDGSGPNAATYHFRLLRGVQVNNEGDGTCPM